MNNMTGDPNREGRPSVLDLEPYASLNFHQPLDWSRVPMMQPPVIPPGQFNPSINYQPSVSGLGNFSFCTNETPLPAQFPFPAGNTPVIRAPPSAFQPNTAGQFRCKRKTESPPLQACKQHITEEKMAEHMSKLHISSETATSSKETDTERTKRLYMCEEMRKLQSDTILPQSLLNRIQRPCTALVLWTPPRRILPFQENIENNNEESEQDHNQMASEDIVENDLNNMEMDNV